VPPVQPSLRGSLLTGVSALALSASAAYGQTGAQNTPPTLTIWGEGARFWTGGGSFNLPTIPLIGAPYTSLSPLRGYEGAVGFDYRWPNQPWHFVFDIRYGRTRTATSSSSSFRSFVSFPFSTPFFTFLATSTTASQSTEHESHLVVDFMVGRDLGIGGTTPELQFGIRIADLRANAHMDESGRRTFYSSISFFSSATASQTAVGDWSSRFFGIGPRIAIVGGIPIVGPWSVDYAAGIAGLFGDRKFTASVTSSNGTSFYLSTSDTAFIFNADASLALSYAFTPNFKASVGIRGDFYSNALTTYNVSTGALQNIDRSYWGPFFRLTGTF
jgi:hypothetical protein